MTAPARSDQNAHRIAAVQPAGRHRTPTTATSLLNAIRCRRGLALFKARATQIWPVSTDGYRVPSQSGSGVYRVSLAPGAEHCTCPDYARHAHHNRRLAGSFFCKHLYAALLWHIKDTVRCAKIPEHGIPGHGTSEPRPYRIDELERVS